MNAMKSIVAGVLCLAAGVAGARDIQVEAADGLLAAVAEAEDGDVIVLGEKTYTLADDSGKADIVLCESHWGTPGMLLLIK